MSIETRFDITFVARLALREETGHLYLTDCPHYGHENTYPRPGAGALEHRAFAIEYFNPPVASCPVYSLRFRPYTTKPTGVDGLQRNPVRSTKIITALSPNLPVFQYSNIPTIGKGYKIMPSGLDSKLGPRGPYSLLYPPPMALWCRSC